MSKDKLPDQLQECLQAYDAGLTPEECLSAFPEQREELTPLLRRALSLRVAYATTAREEFTERARAALLFRAGREVTQALAAQPDQRFVGEARARFVEAAGASAQQALRGVPDPDPDFVAGARERFIRAAGAPAQEALRAVPPPRLPFWVNARRRFLEAASMPRPRHAQPFFGAMGLRTSLSMAVVVLAVAIAVFAYFGGGQQQTAASEIALLESELVSIEARAAAGQPVSASEFIALSKRTTELAEKLNEQHVPAPATVKLNSLAARQQTVVEKVYTTTPPPPEVVQAQQQLDERVRLLASTQPTAPASVASSTPEAPPTSTVPAGPTATATITPVPAPLLPGQVRYSLLPNDQTYGLTWMEVRTASLRFLVPSDWEISGVTVDGSGVATLASNFIPLRGRVGSQPVVVIVSALGRPGEIRAIVNKELVLRTDAGVVISVAELVTEAGPAAPHLRRLIETFQINVQPVTAVPPPPPAPPPSAPATVAPSATASATTVPPSPTATPRAPQPATNTPAPAVTPTRPAVTTPAANRTPVGRP
jgi:hypothetical protein